MIYINVFQFWHVQHNTLNCMCMYNMGVLEAVVGEVVKITLRIWEASIVVRACVCVWCQLECQSNQCQCVLGVLLPCILRCFKIDASIGQGGPRLAICD